MLFDDIFIFVKSLLVPDVTSPDDQIIDDFLNELFNSTQIFSQRLSACIGIDLKVYLKEFGNGKELAGLCHDYRTIIKNTKTVTLPRTLKFGANDPHILFALSLSEYGSHHCLPAIKIIEIVSYTRITSFDSFYRYIIGRNLAYNSDIAIDFDPNESKMRNFYKDFSEYKMFRDINVCNLSSSTPWVFATEKVELDEHFGTPDLPEALNQIGYYIGEKLSPDWAKNIYIYLTYPDTFEEDMYHPTALTGDWGNLNSTGDFRQGNEFFMSFRNNTHWGQTYPVTGNGDGVRERAHLELRKKPKEAYAFSVGDLKELTVLLVKATAVQIIAEARTRYDDIDI